MFVDNSENVAVVYDNTRTCYKNWMMRSYMITREHVIFEKKNWMMRDSHLHKHENSLTEIHA